MSVLEIDDPRLFIQQIVEDTIAKSKKPKPPKRDKDFWRMRNGTLALLESTPLSKSELQVIFALIRDCRKENLVEKFNRRSLQQRTGLTRQALWAALKELAREKVIFFHDPADPDSLYIDPQWCWRGLTEELAGAKTRYDKWVREGRPSAEIFNFDPTIGRTVEVAGDGEF